MPPPAPFRFYRNAAAKRPGNLRARAPYQFIRNLLLLLLCGLCQCKVLSHVGPIHAYNMGPK